MRYNRWVRVLRNVVVVLLAVVVVILLAAATYYWYQQWTLARSQEPLEAFYTPPEPVTGEPGTVLRSEAAPLWNVTGSDAQRVLYVTEGVDGVRRVASATVWIPSAPAKQPRRVVAWAHGTIGLGDECAPSRNPANMPTMAPWLEQMMAAGWIVTATDYQGLGTPAPYSYLVGEPEARDVVNSVRAARSMPGADASKDWAVFGISQGGHAALWAGDRAADLAPELSLRAVAAAAPAAPLDVILEQQWDTGVAWAIGPEVVVSWPSWISGLDPATIVSDAGAAATDSQAQDCVMTAALFGLARQQIGQRYFSSSPLADPSWSAAIAEQIPPVITDLPVLIPVGTKDNVVLPGSIAYLQRQWCKAGADLTMDWLGGVDHVSAAQVAAPAVVDWLSDRFAGRKTQPNCAQPPPVAPYQPSAAASS